MDDSNVFKSWSFLNPRVVLLKLTLQKFRDRSDFLPASFFLGFCCFGHFENMRLNRREFWNYSFRTPSRILFFKNLNSLFFFLSLFFRAPFPRVSDMGLENIFLIEMKAIWVKAWYKESDSSWINDLWCSF